MRVNGDMPINMLVDDEAYEESAELTHWGIKGMRWGIRRYQNKDGSLTPAGKKRLKAETDKVKAKEQVLKRKQATKAKIDNIEARRKTVREETKKLNESNSLLKNLKKKKPAARTASDMTDEELVAAINRKRLEDTYNQLHPKQVSKGEKFLSDFVGNTVAPSLTKAAGTLINEAALKVGKKWLGLDEKTADTYASELKKEVDRLKNEDLYRTYKRKEKAAADEMAKAAADEVKAQKEAAAKAKSEKQAAKAEKVAQKTAAREAKATAKAAAKAEKAAAEAAQKAADDQARKTAERIYAYRNAMEKSRENTIWRTATKLSQDDYDFTSKAASGRATAGRYDRTLISELDDYQYIYR